MALPRTESDIQMTVKTSKNGGPTTTFISGGSSRKKTYVVRTPALSGFTNKQGEQEGSYFASGLHEVIVEEGNPILEKVGNVVGYEILDKPSPINYDPEWAKGGANPSPFLGMTRVQKEWDEPAKEQREMVENEQALDRLRREKEIEALTGENARVAKLEARLSEALKKIEQPKDEVQGGKTVTPDHVNNPVRPRGRPRKTAQL